MKKVKQLLVATILLLLFATCGVNYTITTRIFPDGSCLRIMTARLDSSEFNENPFFIHIDSTWKESITMEHDTSENKTFALVTVQKKYPSVEAMNKEFYRKDSISEAPNLTIRLKKKFQWFYTKFRFEETYVQQFPFRHFPLIDYFTQEEIEVWIFEDPVADSIYFSNTDSLERVRREKEFEQTGDDFIADNIFEEFYGEIQKVSENSDENFFKKHDLVNIKSEMKAKSKQSFTFFGEESSDTSAYQLLFQLDTTFKTKAFTNLLLIDPTAFKTFEKKLNNDYLANINDDYEHNVTLPGTLLNTNAHQIIDGNPKWKFELEQYVFTDFTMWAESRKTNKWAFIVTVAIILLSISMPLFRKRKK